MLTGSAFRAADRIGEAFADAPPDDELDDGQRALWDTWATGRAARAGVAVNEGRARYLLRLATGFSDATDAAFDRLWREEQLTWGELAGLRAELASADPRPPRKARTGVKRATLRAAMRR